jgi:GNAT superfamily N-acetyltransferase
VIRPVRPGDGEALAAMFARCSEDTRYRRFHGFVPALPAAYLSRCLDGRHRAFVAEPPGAGVVALASAGPVFDDPRVYEAGVMVEDDWQRRGVGGMLLATLFTATRAAGADRMRLVLCRAQPSLLAYAAGRADVVARDVSGCDVTFEVAVPAPPVSRRRSRAAEPAR